MGQYFAQPIIQRMPSVALPGVTAPTFTGISSATPVNDGSAVVAFPAASGGSANPIKYRVFVQLGSISAAVLFAATRWLETETGSLSMTVFTDSSGATLVPGAVYTFGVRAVDAVGNMETNTAIVTATIAYSLYALATAIKAKTDNLPADPASNTQVNTRLASSGYTAPDNTGVAAIKAKTDNLPADPASNTQVNTRLASSAYTAPDNTGVAAIKAKTDNLPADPAKESTVAAVGGVAFAIKSKTDNLPADPASNTQVNTRLASSGYTAPDNSGVAAIKAKTDNLPADPAKESTVAARPTNPVLTTDPRLDATLNAALAGL